MPSDFARRMGELLGQMRRNMDGVTAEAMYNAGVRGLLNYGVGIPTIRAISRSCGPDHMFAKYLYRQQVRELRMAAVSIAVPGSVTVDELPFWIGEGQNLSTELLDELAMQLISRTAPQVLDAVAGEWLERGSASARYAALMSFSRAKGYDMQRVLTAMSKAVGELPDDMRLAHGAVIWAASAASADESMVPQIWRTAEMLSTSGAAGRHFADETEWLISE